MGTGCSVECTRERREMQPYDNISGPGVVHPPKAKHVLCSRPVAALLCCLLHRCSSKARK
jgi:hypothetical protein